MSSALKVSAILFVVDQLTKLAVVQWLNLKEIGVFEVFPPFLTFRMAWNQGVNFGLFASEQEFTRWLLVCIAVAVSLWLLNWTRRMNHWTGPFFIGLVVGGAIGNAVDRVVYGAVADFLNMSCCGLNNPFAFNVADVAIFIGAFGLVLFSSKLEKQA